MKCAIASIAIGADYQSSYAAIFKPSVERYVARYDYDLIVFSDYIGGQQYRDPRLVTFMKMLIPLQEAARSYDFLMVLDVDILISAQAPPFHTLDIGSKIGVVDEWCQPSLKESLEFQTANGLERSPREYYHLAGFQLETDALINSGMFICTPRLTREFFEDIVDRYIEVQRTHPRGLHFEQSMFGYELQTNDVARLLPAKWNRVWPRHRRTLEWGTTNAHDATERFFDLERFREVYDASFLLHLTGGLDHDLAFISRNR